MIRPKPTARSVGDRGEITALHHLQKAGLELVERNYLTPGGEIDLVMRDGESVVFVEVRRRSDTRFGSALESITATKRRRLVRAALHYLQRHGERPCRFDVVGLDARGNIDWIADAFRADL